MLLNPFWYGAAVATDPNFANVVLLCHFDGTNGAQTMVDSSLQNHSVTSTLNHKLTTAQAKFGSASLDSSPTGRAASADSADWALGAGQFTVEAWVRPTIAISGARVIVGQWQTAGNLAWVFRFNATVLQFTYSTTGSDIINRNGTYSPTLNTWVHLAVDRDASNMVRFYADGVILNSGAVGATIFDSPTALTIGNDFSTSAAFTGQIDELRITKGVARYGGAFTPPTAPFPDS